VIPDGAVPGRSTNQLERKVRAETNFVGLSGDEEGVWRQVHAIRITEDVHEILSIMQWYGSWPFQQRSLVRVCRLLLEDGSIGIEAYETISL